MWTDGYFWMYFYSQIEVPFMIVKGTELLVQHARRGHSPANLGAVSMRRSNRTRSLAAFSETPRDGAKI